MRNIKEEQIEVIKSLVVDNIKAILPNVIQEITPLIVDKTNFAKVQLLIKTLMNI